MPTETYTPLQTITLSAPASSITFSSIPSTHRDLILIARGKSTSSAYDQAIYLNGDTASGNYSCVILYGNGTSSGSTTSSFIIDYYGSVTTDNTAGTVLQIFDYSASDRYKNYLSRANRAASGTDAIAGKWNNTAAVNSLTYFLNAGTLAAGTTVSLYGVDA